MRLRGCAAARLRHSLRAQWPSRIPLTRDLRARPVQFPGALIIGLDVTHNSIMSAAQLETLKTSGGARARRPPAARLRQSARSRLRRRSAQQAIARKIVREIVREILLEIVRGDRTGRTGVL